MADLGSFATQHPLFDLPAAGLYPIDVREANRLLIAWNHKLGPVHRPFSQEAFAFCVDGRSVSVAVSASAISATVKDSEGRVYRRTEIVELARQASDPEASWASRIMVRLWREICAPRWSDWPVVAAISYSHNSYHSGNQYRFDGWELWADNCGSRGGGTWSRGRCESDAATGKKKLWGWRYVRSFVAGDGRVEGR